MYKLNVKLFALFLYTGIMPCGLLAQNFSSTDFNVRVEVPTVTKYTAKKIGDIVYVSWMQKQDTVPGFYILEALSGNQSLQVAIVELVPSPLDAEILNCAVDSLTKDFTQLSYRLTKYVYSPSSEHEVSMPFILSKRTEKPRNYPPHLLTPKNRSL